MIVGNAKLGLFNNYETFNAGGNNIRFMKDHGKIIIIAERRDGKKQFVCVGALKKFNNVRIETSDVNPSFVLLSSNGIRIVIDYENMLFAINTNSFQYTHGDWGNDCCVEWERDFDSWF